MLKEYRELMVGRVSLESLLKDSLEGLRAGISGAITVRSRIGSKGVC